MKRAVCVMTLLGAGVLLGCGGDDDPAPETPVVTPTAQTPSTIGKQDFIEQGDGICAEVNAALGTLTASEEADATGQRADLHEGMVERLRGLGTPDDEAGLDPVLDAADDLAAAELEAADAAEAGDETALAAAEATAASAQSEFSSAAADYGFEECGQGEAAPTTTSADAPTATAPVTPAPVAPTTPPAPAPTSSAPSGGTGDATSPDTGTAGGGTPDTGGGGTSGSGGVGPG